MPTSTLHAVVHGRVQGVFFRVSTRDAAARLGLGGWVKNLPDGTVEVFAEGERSLLEDFHRWLGRGPEGARVTAVDADWGEGDGDPSPRFDITG
jgi:acylphosphatase